MKLNLLAQQARCKGPSSQAARKQCHCSLYPIWPHDLCNQCTSSSLHTIFFVWCKKPNVESPACKRRSETNTLKSLAIFRPMASRKNLPIIIVQCHQRLSSAKFHWHYRKPKESVATFVAELHLLAEHCRYRGTLKYMLRETFVWGIMNDAIQQCSTVAQNVQTLKKLPNVGEVLNLSEKSTERHVHKATDKHIMYHSWEKRTHRKCLHKEAVCHNCGKTGHFKAAGWSKLNKKQQLEWHVEEESSQDELQLLVKSRFIPYGRCTCSLRIDSSKLCSRRWFIAEEYPQMSRSGR